MKRILCFFGIHKYEEVAMLSEQGHLLGCPRCTKIWGYDHSVNIKLEWSFAMGAMYARHNPKKLEEACKKYDEWLKNRRYKHANN